MPNLADLSQLAYDTTAATWPFTAISTILFFMRSFSRFWIQKERFAWDDGVITLAWAIDIVGAAFSQRATDSTHRLIAAPTSMTLLSPAAFWALFTTSWGYVSTALPKLAVGILISRIFRPQQWLRVSIISYCIALNILAVIVLIFSFAQCDPPAGQWDPFHHPNAHCRDKNIQLGLSTVTSGLSAFADIAFTIYPAVVIWNLQMPLATKVGAISLMSLGLASFAFAIIKLCTLIVLSKASQGGPYNTVYYCIQMILWSRLENDFVISAACLPAAPPCFRAGKRMLTTSPPTYPTYQNLTRSHKSNLRSRDQRDTEMVGLNPKDSKEEVPLDNWGIQIKVGTEIKTSASYA